VFGTTSSTVCQPAGGCRIQGDTCRTNADCCGGSTVGSPNSCPLPGDGEVTCQIFDATRGLGVCTKPQGQSCNPQTTTSSCIPEGDVCHCQLIDPAGFCWDSGNTCQNNNPNNPSKLPCKSLPSGCTVSGVNSNCCSNPGADKMTCRLDAVGVPRCFTVGNCSGSPDMCSTSCVAAGMACATSADCCGGNVCIPNSSGQFVCGTTSCVMTGGKCTSTGDCCPGSGNVCIIQPGQTTGVCGNPNPPPPPPPDGGTTTPDGGTTTTPDMATTTCSFAGQQCSSSQPCCAGAGTCYNGFCETIIF
jgi:hypothetical protein